MTASPSVRRPAALLFLAASAVVVTPLCGLLFQCGCDWPWAGLVAECNYFRPGSEYRCPWCVSSVAAGLSIGTAGAAGLGLAVARWPRFADLSCLLEIPLRAAAGTALFALASVPGAALSAWFQDYPLGIGGWF